MQDDLVGATKLAQLLEVDRSTVHRRIARGELTPYITIDGRPFFLVSDVEAIRRGEHHLAQEATK